MGYYIGVDIGGTFTDCVAVDDHGVRYQAKSPSTKADPSEGVVQGLARVAETIGISLDALLASTDRFSHGTTIGTNMVIERTGAKVALLTTVGHRDALLMMRGTGRVTGRMPDSLFSLRDTGMPNKLVPRDQIHEVIERVDADGEIVVRLDDRNLAQILERIEQEGIQSVAVNLLWSFTNSEHEKRIGAALASLPSKPYVALSSEISPRIGEYERAAATAISAYLGPGSMLYLDRLETRLRSQRLERAFLVMQSNGGVGTVDDVKRQPLRLLDSGPAGGMVGVDSLARHYGHRNVIATDMGGTSFDVGLIVDGAPLTRNKGIIDHYTYYLPHLDVTSIACGGGSIARYDEHSGSMQVGPRSAGSEPGPACYGRGGREATVTDADVVLGLVDADSFLGGTMPLDKEAAFAAVARIAERLNVTTEEAASGILRLNNFRAATLIRQKSLQSGYDPRDFVVYAYGGAGPVHAFDFARELDVAQVIVPLGNAASVLSAYGISSANFVRQFESPLQAVSPFDPEKLEGIFAELEAVGTESFLAMGYAKHDITLTRTVSMRYAEQYMQSLDIVAPDTISVETVHRLEEDFTSDYARLYGEHSRIALRAVEVHHVYVRATVNLGLRIPASLPGAGEPLSPDAVLGARDVYWPSSSERLSSKVYAGPKLKPGNRVEGPAVIELPHTSVPIAPGQSALVDEIGSLIIHV